MNQKIPTGSLNGGGSPIDEAQVRDLIVGAGQRPALPEEDLATIRAAAKVEWKNLVDRQNSRARYDYGRSLALAASLILAIAAVWWWVSTNNRVAPVSTQVVATIEMVEGGVGDGLSVGQEIFLGSSIETRKRRDGTPHRLALRLAGGASLRIDSSSELVFNDENLIELRAGGVYMDTGSKPGSSEPVAITTDFGVVRHVGTQYEVRLLDSDQAVRIRVREGRVALRSDTESFSIESGQQLELAGDGREELKKIPTHGSEWSWAFEIAPRMQIDGLPLRSYFEWISRETGRTLIFESAEVESYAAEHRISAPPVAYTPMQSIEIVRPSTDLKFREQNGSILIFGPKNPK